MYIYIYYLNYRHLSSHALPYIYLIYYELHSQRFKITFQSNRLSRLVNIFFHILP